MLTLEGGAYRQNEDYYRYKNSLNKESLNKVAFLIFKTLEES